MNHKRQEMETKLPPPSQLLCSHLWAKTNEAGLKLTQEDIVLLSRLFCDYVQNTKDGKLTALKLLNATVKPADPRDAYYPYGQGPQSTPLSAKELQSFAGWIYKGGFCLNTEQIEIEKNGGMEACESTGILGPRDYCVKTIKDYGRDGEVLVTLSNYARLMSEKAAVRDTANMKTCEECLIKHCPYHLKKEPQQLLLTTGVSHGFTSNNRDNFF